MEKVLIEISEMFYRIEIFFLSFYGKHFFINFIGLEKIKVKILNFFTLSI